MPGLTVLRAYYTLAKPGIIRGNLLSAAAGFLLASGRTVDWLHMVVTLAGIGFVIGSGCVFNNYIDRSIDKKMPRTRNRALVTGVLPAKMALLYGTLLGLSGLGVLAAYTNLLTAGIGVLGIVFYVVVYGFMKRRSDYGTLVGSISGALPPVAGYTAVTGGVDSTAAVLFLILVCWQMPHFYAIGIVRAHEYKLAGVPVLPLTRGVRAAKQQSLVFSCLFLLASLALTVVSQTGVVYAVIALAAGFWLLLVCIRGFAAADDVRWGRRLFGTSLLVLLAWSTALSIDAVLL